MFKKCLTESNDSNTKIKKLNFTDYLLRNNAYKLNIRKEMAKKKNDIKKYFNVGIFKGSNFDNKILYNNYLKSFGKYFFGPNGIVTEKSKDLNNYYEINNLKIGIDNKIYAGKLDFESFMSKLDSYTKRLFNNKEKILLMSKNIDVANSHFDKVNKNILEKNKYFNPNKNFVKLNRIKVKYLNSSYNEYKKIFDNYYNNKSMNNKSKTSYQIDNNNNNKINTLKDIKKIINNNSSIDFKDKDNNKDKDKSYKIMNKEIKQNNSLSYTINNIKSLNNSERQNKQNKFKKLNISNLTLNNFNNYNSQRDTKILKLFDDNDDNDENDNKDNKDNENLRENQEKMNKIFKTKFNSIFNHTKNLKKNINRSKKRITYLTNKVRKLCKNDAQTQKIIKENENKIKTKHYKEILSMSKLRDIKKNKTFMKTINLGNNEKIVLDYGEIDDFIFG